MWCLRVDTYENKERMPVLTHVFYGQTKAEADGIYRAHLQTDSFLKASVTTHRFRDFSVRSVRSWSQT